MLHASQYIVSVRARIDHNIKCREVNNRKRAWNVINKTKPNITLAFCNFDVGVYEIIEHLNYITWINALLPWPQYIYSDKLQRITSHFLLIIENSHILQKF